MGVGDAQAARAAAAASPPGHLICPLFFLYRVKQKAKSKGKGSKLLFWLNEEIPDPDGEAMVRRSGMMYTVAVPPSTPKGPIFNALRQEPVVWELSDGTTVSPNILIGIHIVAVEMQGIASPCGSAELEASICELCKFGHLIRTLFWARRCDDRYSVFVVGRG